MPDTLKLTVREDKILSLLFDIGVQARQLICVQISNVGRINLAGNTGMAAYNYTDRI